MMIAGPVVPPDALRKEPVVLCGGIYFLAPQNCFAKLRQWKGYFVSQRTLKRKHYERVEHPACSCNSVCLFTFRLVLCNYRLPSKKKRHIRVPCQIHIFLFKDVTFGRRMDQKNHRQPQRSDIFTSWQICYSLFKRRADNPKTSTLRFKGRGFWQRKRMDGSFAKIANTDTFAIKVFSAQNIFCCHYWWQKKNCGRLVNPFIIKLFTSLKNSW